MRSRGIIAGLLLGVALCGCQTLEDFSHLIHPKSDGKVVAVTPDSTCYDLAPENKLHPLGACETKVAYQVTVGGTRQRFERTEFRRTLRERLFEFVRATDYPWRTLAGAEIEVWLVAPLFAPEEASFVAVVLGPAGNFAVRLPLDPGAWRVDADDVAWLGQETYPSPHALKVGHVMVQGKNGVGGPGRLQELLAASDVGKVRTAAGEPALLRVVPDGAAELVELETAPFSEGAVARRVLAAPRAGRVVGRIGRIPAKDPVGYKARVFHFGFAD